MRPRIALLPWGDIFEDWLDPLGVNPETLRDEVTGSWMFGYADALRSAGVDTVLVCFTGRVNEAVRWTHAPTGATLWLVPRGRLAGSVSRHMLREPLGDRVDPVRVGRAVLRNLSPYFSTPLRALIHLIREERCTALLCQEYETPRFDACILAGALAHVPVFASFQGGDYHVSRLEGPLRPWTIRRAEKLVIATADEAARVRRRYAVPSGKIAQIFNPVDVEVWHPHDRATSRARLGISPEALLVLWHGQLQMHRKGLDLLLDAWSEIRLARPGRSLELYLVGGGADAEHLRERISALDLTGITLGDTWVNGRERISELLSAGDVYVFPSRHEGFPMAPIEAMACGLPVVATSAQGISDILAAGPAHGGLVVPRNDVRALVDALGDLLDDDDRRLELGRLARKRAVSAFSVDTVGRELRSVLLREGE